MCAGWQTQAAHVSTCPTPSTWALRAYANRRTQVLESSITHPYDLDMSQRKQASLSRTFLAVPLFLADPQSFYADVRSGHGLRQKCVDLAVSALAFLMVFGFVTGLSHGVEQALSSAIKMPLLFGVTMLFCLPALYFFSLAVLGAHMSFAQAAAVVLSGVAVTALLLLGLAPITLFFVLTSSNYGFFQLLAVLFVGLSGYIGLYFLWNGMTAVESNHNAPAQRLGRMILRTWTVLYGFVGSQMAWRLSPIIGDPAQPFVFLKPSRDNFYVDLANALGATFGARDEAWSSALITLVAVLQVIVAIVAVLALTASPTRNRDLAAAEKPDTPKVEAAA